MSDRSPADTCNIPNSKRRRLRHVKCIIARNLVLPPQNPVQKGEPDGNIPASIPETTGRVVGGENGSEVPTLEKLPLAHLYNRRRKPSVGSYRPPSRRTSSTTSVQRLFHERYSKVVSVSVTQLLDAFYTLSSRNRDGRDALPFYSSEVVETSINPAWDSLDEASFAPGAPLSASQFTLRVYIRRHDEDQFRISMEKVVDLDDLTYVGEDIGDGDRKYPVNTIVFALDDGFYQLSANAKTTNQYPRLSRKSSSASVSYDYESILTMLAAEKELWILEQEVGDLVTKGDGVVSREQAQRTICEEYRSAKHSSGILEDRVREEKENVKRLQDQLQQLRSKAKKSRERLHTVWAANDENIQSLQSRSAALDDERNETRHAQRAARVRQRSLILDVASIYPIALSSSGAIRAGGTLQVHTIRGLGLPNSEFTGYDDEAVATALGFTSHLICMIAFYLHIPLRYPLTPTSSRSFVVDTVSEHYVGNKQFPLYSRGVEKIRFEYGVFLLNKDVEQLMNHLHLTITNLRHTLPNLKAIIDVIRGWDVNGKTPIAAAPTFANSDEPIPDVGSDNSSAGTAVTSYDAFLCKMDGQSQAVTDDLAQPSIHSVA
ncbi:UV radiation resistance protein and autophagy-related subunit 14-domain-containing protein [Powellomyces hirtus]|nr:UV radiation resistance protein and autophagy-related subunit 14-domain-containing protein [Powellomyces hirtus]